MLCIGHSHINAAAAAAEERGWKVIRLRERDRESGKVSQTLPDEVTQRAGDPIASFIGGNVHTKLAMVRWPKSFDFIWPERDWPLDDGAEIVPLDAIRSTLAYRCRPYTKLLASLAEAAKGPMFHVESPPPPRDDDYFLEHIGRMPGITPEDIARGVAPAALRYKTWRVHSEMIRDLCAKLGVRYIERPAEAVDEDGFLKLDFAFNPTHGNTRYGELVAEQLEAAL